MVHTQTCQVRLMLRQYSLPEHASKIQPFLGRLSQLCIYVCLFASSARDLGGHQLFFKSEEERLKMNEDLVRVN